MSFIGGKPFLQPWQNWLFFIKSSAYHPALSIKISPTCLLEFLARISQMLNRHRWAETQLILTLVILPSFFFPPGPSTFSAPNDSFKSPFIQWQVFFSPSRDIKQQLLYEFYALMKLKSEKTFKQALVFLQNISIISLSTIRILQLTVMQYLLSPCQKTGREPTLPFSQVNCFTIYCC